MPELHTDCEIVWCKLELVGHKSIYLSTFYNPKTSNEEGFKQFGNSVERATRITNAYIKAAGDFNLPGWDLKKNTLKPSTAYSNIHHQFTDILDDHGLNQVVVEPMRGPNILDLIVTNYPSSFRRTEVIPGLSDHGVVYAEVDLLPARGKQRPRQIPLYKKVKWDNVRSDLSDIHRNIETMKEEGKSGNEMWMHFQEHLELSVKTNIPHKTARQKDRSPWITRDLRRLINKRDRWYKRKKKSGNLRDTNRYKELKRETQRHLRQVYRYIDSIVTPPQDESQTPQQNCVKRFWTYIKHKRSDGSNIPPLKADGVIHPDSVDKANILNNQFKEAFSPKSDLSEEELNNRCTLSGNYPTIPDLTITNNGICKLLNNLNPHKAAGPDNITPRILKGLSSEISPILSIIFNASYSSGEIPSIWWFSNHKLHKLTSINFVACCFP